MMFEAKINNKQPQPRRSGGAGGAQRLVQIVMVYQK
jgi:hypothetical protein